ncbi:maestro heat-like repeat-containing protein family member 1 [Hemicordylus capensis]|uniref:maestro heat-like repeat-containing protein family member 1 n=1 Tax=Hemicordylus capensis TaxID=884348 RepID=UPI00230403D0|nr:maestro heat-like repeat-containing protein family member 1 [Hemicordylus capensis]
MLCYGQAAFGAKPEEMFAEAELFVTEILFQFHSIYKDEAMKRCFLKSVVMITKALHHCKKEDIHLPHKTELVICIMEVIDEEPLGSFSITVLHQAITTVSYLTTLKPPLDSVIKSDLVCKSIEKVYSLPSLKLTKLKAGSPTYPTQTQDFYQQTINACNSMLIGLLSETPNMESLQDILIYTNGWIESQKNYERERAVRSTNHLLKFVSEHLDFDITQEFSLLGNLVALLSLRIADRVEDIGKQAAEAIYYLHYIIMGKLAREMERKPKNKKGNVVKWFREDFFVSGPSVFFNNISKVAKAFGEHLVPGQISELVLRAIDNLTHEEKAISQTAGMLLSSFLEECGTDMEDLPMIIKEIYNHLPVINDPITKEETLKAVRNLATKRLNGVVDILLECSLEYDNSSIAEMWKTLACDPYSNIKLIRPLLKRLKDEDPLSDVCNRRHSKSLMPIAATNALCVILSLPESADAIQGKFPHLLIALVTQIYFVVGTGRRGSKRLSNAEFPSTPLSSAIQALKNLTVCAGYEKEYNILGMQSCWDKLATPEDFFEGVLQLIRTLFAFNKMHLKLTFKQANTYMRRPDVKERTVGMAFFTEDEALEPFLSPLLTHALGSDRMTAKESIKTLQIMFRHLDPNNFAPMRMALIPHLLGYFNNDDNELRVSSIGLFGILLKRIKDRSKQSLKEEVFKAFVPLLIQLMDPCTREVSKDALATCISSMNWEDVPKDVKEIDPNVSLFYAYKNICKYLVQKNRQKLPEMAAQMTEYLRSRFTSHRQAAAILIGCNAQYMKSDLSAKDIEDIYIALQELQADHEPTVAKIAAEANEEFLRHCGHWVNPNILASTSIQRSSNASETRK